jgi:hypothetical protein
MFIFCQKNPRCLLGGGGGGGPAEVGRREKGTGGNSLLGHPLFAPSCWWVSGVERELDKLMGPWKSHMYIHSCRVLTTVMDDGQEFLIALAPSPSLRP